MSADELTTCPKCKDEVFRAWYDIGISEEGLFAIDYYGRCENKLGCGFAISYYKDYNFAENNWEQDWIDE